MSKAKTYEQKYSEEERDLMNKVYGLPFNNKETWFKSYEIQEELDLSGAEVREAVHNIRVEAFPILSGSKGYKYATDIEDLNHTIASMFSRIGSIGEASRGLVQSRDRFFGKQLNVNDDEMERFFDRIREAIDELEEAGHE